MRLWRVWTMTGTGRVLTTSVKIFPLVSGTVCTILLLFPAGG
jgi:hypothetical protein